MILRDIGLLGVSNNRSRAYLQRMLFHQLVPNHVVQLINPKDTLLPGQRVDDLGRHGESTAAKKLPATFEFDETEPLETTLKAHGIPTTSLNTVDVNSVEVIAALRGRPETIWIYSGPGGALVGRDLLALGKRFLHIHPGLLPNYRGSTTIYFSLLAENSVGASAIFLASEIDAGPVIAAREFSPPQDRREIDYRYDPLVRSELLVEVLERYAKNGRFETRPQDVGGKPFYIIHPVLKHVAILAGDKV